MKYRSRTEIIAMILKAASEKVTKTKIMYKAYLSYTQVKEYLAYLEENELIKYEKGIQVYTTTQKGWQFLRAYDNIIDLVSPKISNSMKNFI